MCLGPEPDFLFLACKVAILVANNALMGLDAQVLPAYKVATPVSSDVHDELVDKVFVLT